MKKYQIMALAALTCLLLSGATAHGATAYGISNLFTIDNRPSGTRSDGSRDAPFPIANTGGWLALMNGDGVWDRHFRLEADIDLDGVALSPVGDGTIEQNGWLSGRYFNGVLDGGGHVVSNAKITAPEGAELVGLFQMIGPEGAVLNLDVFNIEIDAGPADAPDDELSSDVGGLAGVNFGEIVNCAVTGNVSGGRYVGGIAGGTGASFDGKGIISRSWADVAVSGRSYVGGLVGDIFRGGEVADCYAKGEVTGTGHSIGGLAGGSHDGAIMRSYSTAVVNAPDQGAGGLLGVDETGGAVTAGFWDTDVSGRSSSDGGTGLNTAGMMSRSTYTDAGWDLDQVWTIDDGAGYPKLRLGAVSSDGYEGGALGVEERDFESWTDCFIATAAYGTPLAPELDVLRGLRDDVLLESEAGRGAVGLYYRVSPPVARVVERSELLRATVRGVLERVVTGCE